MNLFQVDFFIIVYLTCFPILICGIDLIFCEWICDKIFTGNCKCNINTVYLRNSKSSFSVLHIYSFMLGLIMLMNAGQKSRMREQRRGEITRQVGREGKRNMDRIMDRRMKRGVFWGLRTCREKQRNIIVIIVEREENEMVRKERKCKKWRRTELTEQLPCMLHEDV